MAGERKLHPYTRLMAYSGWRAQVTSIYSVNGLSKQTPAHLISADREPQPAYPDYSQRIQTINADALQTS